MASRDFVIRCKTADGSFVMKSVTGESTVKELKEHLSKETKMRPECIKILHGYPPEALTDDVDDMQLKDVNICSGETIIIEKQKRVTEAAVSTSEPLQPIPIIEPIRHILSGGIMMRHVVPSNNSCLFASVYFVLSNGDLNPEKSTELRKLIARVVSSNPEKYNGAFLGMSNNDYCDWIQNPDHWGGAIELAILSEHFRIEIVAVDTISLKMHRFGESSNYPNRIFLIYDGIHYDPLVLEMDEDSMQSVQSIFPADEDGPMEMALEIAREAKSSRQYTDVANFTLRCCVCNQQLRGDKEAREHAAATGHVEFGEVTK